MAKITISECDGAMEQPILPRTPCRPENMFLKATLTPKFLTSRRCAIGAQHAVERLTYKRYSPRMRALPRPFPLGRLRVPPARRNPAIGAAALNPRCPAPAIMPRPLRPPARPRMPSRSATPWPSIGAGACRVNAPPASGCGPEQLGPPHPARPPPRRALALPPPPPRLPSTTTYVGQ